jgi:hypothetical protein
MGQFFRMIAASRLKCGHAKGKKINVASVQRRQASVTGGIKPTMARPSTKLPAQKMAVSVRSSAGRSKNDLKSQSSRAHRTPETNT